MAKKKKKKPASSKQAFMSKLQQKQRELEEMKRLNAALRGG